MEERRSVTAWCRCAASVDVSSPQQPFAEGGLVRWQAGGDFFAAGEDGEAFGDFDGTGSEFGFHHIRELRGVGGFQGDGGHARMGWTPFLAGQPAHGTVRIDLVIEQRLDGADGRAGLVVAEGHAADAGSHGIPRTAEERLHADEIRGGADVHGVGNGRHARARSVFAGSEVLRHHIVAVGGGDEVIDRQAELHREQTCGEIAEIAGGDDKGRFHAFGQLGGRVDVVETLRDEAREVDRVCRGQVEAFGEFAIQEGGFDEGLAVVERTFDFKGGDVAAERGELLFLEAGDLALRIEDDDAGARDVWKAEATAPPVSPEVATSTVSSRSSSRVSQAIRRAMKRAPKSLKASVGPWNSSRM